MNPIYRPTILAALGSATLLAAETVPPVEAPDFVYEVRPQASYADPEEVNFECTMFNHSDMTMLVVSIGQYRIRLIGPDGNPVRPYPFHRSKNTGAYAVVRIPPGETYEQGLRLSGLFPFPLAGEYRCFVTRRVYRWVSAEIPDVRDLLDQDYYGTPVDVSTPEVRFRIEKPTSPDRPRKKIDPENGIRDPGFEYDFMPKAEYYSRGERFLKRDKPPGATPGTPEKTPPTRQYGIPASIVVLVIAALGLLWRRLKRRER